jgi:hypothetical protein
MREGVRRLAVAIRWASILWIGGVVIAYLAFDGDLADAAVSDIVGGLIFMLLPGVLGLGLAWVLGGFAQPDRRRDSSS